MLTLYVPTGSRRRVNDSVRPGLDRAFQHICVLVRDAHVGIGHDRSARILHRPGRWPRSLRPARSRYAVTANTMKLRTMNLIEVLDMVSLLIAKAANLMFCLLSESRTRRHRQHRAAHGLAWTCAEPLPIATSKKEWSVFCHGPMGTALPVDAFVGFSQAYRRSSAFARAEHAPR